ncbi:SRPBCC family protein [Nocardia tengchongensis]|uniref:SRPBCC family protein n=1 Tax=Nocardia tengchongensis TaxID=2055889 RepID=UPI0036B624E9
MTEQSFTTTVTVDQSPEVVFDAVLDVRGWWSKSLVGGTERAGDAFTYEIPGVHRIEITVTEVVPGQKVVWRVLDSWLGLVDDKTEWNDTEIRFEITEVDEVTTLHFTHVGLVPEFECFDVCRNGWVYNIEKSLRDRIMTGTGLPGEDPQTRELSTK